MSISILLFYFTIFISMWPSSSSSSSSYDYKDALSKSLLYFESQRSGRLPYNQRATWRHHSALTDGLQQGVDLVGGYYDAGDHVKFGLPMAFTVTMLAWSVLQFGNAISQAGELPHALESIKWGTDYFLKAHTNPTLLWAQVGDGETDHYCWQRAEDMTTSRQAFKIDQDHPGSDLAGETSAAMAASSIVFRRTNPHYSGLLLHHARQLFEFGDRHRGVYHESVEAAKGYYTSVSGYKDELLWSALWLYRATGEERYLTYIIDNAVSFGGITWAVTEFSWDIKYAGVQIMAATLPKRIREGKHREVLKEYRAKGEHYLCACLSMNGGGRGNVRRTPEGLLYVRRWNNMQYVSTAAFMAAVWAEEMGGERVRCGGGGEAGVGEMVELARGQVEYMLGGNGRGMSYLVGYGERYPRRVHHRGGSMRGVKESRGFIGCTQGYDDWHGRDEDNPNTVVGALVGGPDEEDGFRDERWNYMQTEACTYNTAPLVGLLAWLHSLPPPSTPPPSHNQTRPLPDKHTHTHTPTSREADK